MRNELKRAKALALKMRVMWKAINKQRTCYCEDCLSNSVKPLRTLAESHDYWGFDEGRSKWAFMGAEWVIKVPRTAFYTLGLRHETARMFRWQKNSNIAEYIPRTYGLRDGFMIQEVVEMISDAQYNKNFKLLERLAQEYDITDLHQWNVGWKHNRIQLFDCPSNAMELMMFNRYMDGHEEGLRQHAKLSA